MFSSSFLRARIAGILLVLTPGLAGAQGVIDHISPPVVERNKTTRVTFFGRDLASAIGLWHSLPPEAFKVAVIESRPDRAVLNVTASAESPVGLFGVRLATRDGLSNAHILLIDDLPTRPAPSDTDSATLKLPASLWGTFREAEVDRYRIDVKSGQTVSFEAVASRFGKNADPLVTIRDAKGRLVVECDNDTGLFYDTRFTHQFASAGIYAVEIRDARFHGSPDHHYVLRMGQFPAARVAVPASLRTGRNLLRLPEIGGPPLAFDCNGPPPAGPFSATFRRPGDDGSCWLPLARAEGEIAVASPRDEARWRAQTLTVSPATTLAFTLSPFRANPFLLVDSLPFTGRVQATRAIVPGTLCGVLERPGERQSFAFELSNGQQLFVRGEARALNSPADLDVILADRFGRELRRSTEARDEVSLDFKADRAGIYVLSVRDQLRDGGPAFAYRLTVRNRPFPPSLVADVEGLTVPQGSSQPIPILVTRTGPAGPIQLRLVGAPAGLTLSPTSIGEKETGVVCRIAASSAVPIGLYTIQIVAESVEGPTLVWTQPLIDKQIVNADLIPLARREDQRRLPPSLADRFAVQVTPPSPFEMELPEPLVALARYQHADFPIVTTRLQGFDGPITFAAKGGQLADKAEGRTRAYAEFPTATASQWRVTGSVHSKILSNIGRTRIDVSGTAVHDSRRVTLNRTFDLNLTTAFAVSAGPAPGPVAPGTAIRFRLNVSRVKSFAGAVNVQFSADSNLRLPERVTVPEGRDTVEVEIAVAADATPGRHDLRVTATALVDGFEEEVSATLTGPEVRKSTGANKQ